MKKLLFSFALIFSVFAQSTAQCEAFFLAIAGENGYYSFDNNSVSNNMENTMFLWQFGDGTIADGPLPSHQYEQSGTYEVCLFMSVMDGDMVTCGDSYCTSIEVTVVSDCPESIFSVAGEDCGVMNFEIGSFVEGEAVTWFPGDETGAVQTGHFFSHTYAEPGEYQVCAFYTSPVCPGGVELCTSIVVEACQSECAVNLVGEANDCDSYIFNIQGTVTGNVIWNFGDETGETSSIAADHTYTSNGVYVVTAQYSGPGCPNGVMLYFTVNIDCIEENNCPQEIWSGAGEDCGVMNFEIGSFVEGEAVTWFPGDETGAVETGHFFSHTYAEPGEYQVCAFYTSPACPNGVELCTNIVVESCGTDCPSEIWSGAGNGCGVMNFEIGSFVQGEAVTWFPGDETGAVETGHFFSHTYAEPGEYQVCAFYTSPACPNGVELCTNIVVEGCNTECPSVINAEFIDCNSFIFTIAGVETGNVIWNFDDGVSETSSVVADHSYADNGVYVVNAQYSGAGCPDGVNINYTVNVACGEEPVCPNEINITSGELCHQFVFSVNNWGESQYGDINWNFGDNEGYGMNDFLHMYMEPGSYNVCAWGTTDACPDGFEICTTLEVEACGGNNEGCPTEIWAYQVNDCGLWHFEAGTPTENENANVIWNFGDGTSTNDFNTIANHQYEADGVYTVSVTIELYGEPCNATIFLETTIEVNACEENPCEIEIWSGPGEECGVMLFEAGSFVEGEEFIWYFGDGTTAEGGHFISHQYTEPGTYTVQCVYSNINCPGYQLYTVIVVEDCWSNCTEVILTLDSYISEGGPSAAYWWLSNNDGVTIDQGVAQYTENDPYYDNVLCLEDGCYTLMLEGLDVANALLYAIQISGESLIQSIDVSNDNLIYITFGVNSDCVESACEASFEPIFTNTPGHIEFQNTSSYDGAAEWHWDYGNGVTSDGQGGNVWYEANGVYVVCLTITTEGCTDTYCETITVTNMESGCELNEVTITINSEYATKDNFDMIELLFNVNDITIEGLDITAYEGTVVLTGCVPDGCYEVTAQAPEGMEITAESISITVDAGEASALLGLNVENNSVSAELGINSDCGDGVTENVLSLFAVYPNPSRDLLSIQNKSNEKIERLEIMDAAGRLVLSANNTDQVQVSTMADGCYFIRVSTAKNTSVLPFIIQH